MRRDSSFIIFNEDKHSYTDVNGNAYLSVSSLLNKLKPEFPREAISKAVAKKRGITQEEVLKEWDDKRDSSIVRGNAIHYAMEEFDKSGSIHEPTWEDMITGVNTLFAHYEEVYSEQVLYYVKALVCGTSDKVAYRGKNTMDYADYKTNESRGIEYTSKYGQYMLPPVGHLEHCNYNHYSLQLSIYSYLDEMQFGYKPGRLFIIFIPPHDVNDWKQIPVPYMRSEARDIIQWRMDTSNIQPITQDHSWA